MPYKLFYLLPLLTEDKKRICRLTTFKDVISYERTPQTLLV